MKPAFPPLRLIVCERTGAWAVALRRGLGNRVELRSTRSLAECRREFAEARESLVVVELTADQAPKIAEFTVWANEQAPPAGVIVVAARELAIYADWMLEAGAIHFVASPRRLGPLREIVKRRRERFPGPMRSLPDEVWAKLPWQDGANG